MGYTLPWALQYLDQKKTGTSYPFVLAAVLNYHNRIGIWPSTNLSIVGWVDACNWNVYPVLFEEFAVVLVSSSKYSGLASILQRKLLDRWGRFQILQIFRVFPRLVIGNTGFVVDWPNYSGYSPVRVENNMDLDLATIAMWFNMPKSDICIHVWVV